MNKVILVGNLANDPEAYTTQNGVSRSTFRLAVRRKYRNAEGNHEADFLTIVVWRQTAEFCNKYLTKGSRVAVEGSIQVRSYDAQDGSKRYVTEVIAESVESLGNSSENHANNSRPNTPDSGMPEGFEEVDDDEIPF